MEDDYYYSSGIVRLDNSVDKQFTLVETYSDYFTSGISLEQPTCSASYHLAEQTYPIKGKIDPSFNKSDPIEHIIVTMTYLDEDLV